MIIYIGSGHMTGGCVTVRDKLHSKNLMHSRMLTDFSMMVSGCVVIQHMPCYQGAWCLISAQNPLSHPITKSTIIYQQ